MPLEVWITFAIASAILVAIPGPTVLTVVSYALSKGRQAGWASVAGVTLGDITAMTLSLAGAGALLATSTILFTALKFCGALYLIWLGINLWRSNTKLSIPTNIKTQASNRTIFFNTFMVTALNPKCIIFFVAFVPQFISTSEPAFPQMVILEATFVTLGATNAFMWAFLASGMREHFSNPDRLKFINRIGASFLISAGLITALAHKT
ncbi:MAG: lysine transporter LysE [Zetaproteobacteria bacterium]|nr:MAG: lysine transporter LysE [Zetaproteobacteria bacterium]